MEKTWQNTMVKGYASYRFAHRLKVLKNEIETWSKEVMGKEKAEFETILNDISDLDMREDSVGLNDEKRGRKGNLKLRLATFLKDKESVWRQWSKEKLFAKGDRNTKYFHALASHWHRSNYIEEVRFEDKNVKE